jgi:hexosaminidase
LIDEEGIELVFGDYSGYIYALETLSQLYSNGKLPHARIQDEPVLAYRGIMIDTARHFLKVSTIKRLIENMPQSKLNILHWHLADDESFPIQLNSHP